MAPEVFGWQFVSFAVVVAADPPLFVWAEPESAAVAAAPSAAQSSVVASVVVVAEVSAAVVVVAVVAAEPVWRPAGVAARQLGT